MVVIDSSCILVAVFARFPIANRFDINGTFVIIVPLLNTIAPGEVFMI